MNGRRPATFAETWWGARWIQALQRLGREWSRSLARGRDCGGDVRDLRVMSGRIEAAVHEDEGEPYQLHLALRPLPEHAWQRVMRRLTRKALYAAKLLAGEMPRDIERVFAQCRTSLFPRRRHEVEAYCSCRGPDQPCWHVAAAQYVLAEAFDRDPFLLFELRGKSRDQLLGELREIRGARASRERVGANALADDNGVEAGAVPRPENYTVAGPGLAAIGFHVAAPDVALGALRSVGPLRSWVLPLSLLKAFAPIYRAANAQALEIAWSGEDEVPITAVLPEPENEEVLRALADSMAKPALPGSERTGEQRRGGRGKRRGRRRGKQQGARPQAKKRGGGRRGGRRRGRRRRGYGGDGGGPVFGPGTAE